MRYVDLNPVRDDKTDAIADNLPPHFVQAGH